VQLNYVKVWKLLGLNKLPAELPTSTLGDPPTNFSLTADPEPYFVHIDRWRAIARQGLKFFEDGSWEEWLDREIQAAKARRAEERQARCYLVAQAISDVYELSLSHRYDVGDFEVAADNLCQVSVGDKYRRAINAFTTGLAVSLPPNVDLRCAEIGSLIYLTTEAGKPLYVLSYRGGVPGLSITSPLPADIVSTAKKLAAIILDDTKLQRPIGLLTSSTNNTLARLSAFHAA
jgi:hypothetical protein